MLDLGMPFHTTLLARCVQHVICKIASPGSFRLLKHTCEACIYIRMHTYTHAHMCRLMLVFIKGVVTRGRWQEPYVWATSTNVVGHRTQTLVYTGSTFHAESSAHWVQGDIGPEVVEGLFVYACVISIYILFFSRMS